MNTAGVTTIFWHERVHVITDISCARCAIDVIFGDALQVLQYLPWAGASPSMRSAHTSSTYASPTTHDPPAFSTMRAYAISRSIVLAAVVSLLSLVPVGTNLVSVLPQGRWTTFHDEQIPSHFRTAILPLWGCSPIPGTESPHVLHMCVSTADHIVLTVR